jgi:uncharacterized membrane protein
LFCAVNKNVVILLLVYIWAGFVIGFYYTEHKEVRAQTIESPRYKYQEKKLKKLAEKGPKEMDRKRQGLGSKKVVKRLRPKGLDKKYKEWVKRLDLSGLAHLEH